MADIGNAVDARSNMVTGNIKNTTDPNSRPMFPSTSADFTPPLNLLPSTEVTITMNKPQSRTAHNQMKKEPPKWTTAYIDKKTMLAQVLINLKKKKKSYATRLKQAVTLSENLTFQNTLRKFTTLASFFRMMKFREVTKNKTDRRFTEKEKIMALSLYKQGPRCYRMLSKIFVLPSSLTLSRLLKRADLQPGINEKLFKVMKIKIQKMQSDDKLCILIFDEIAISPNFEYDSQNDYITGFATNGMSTSNKIADRALVFMVRGVLKNYKQPVAYTFSSGSTRKEELAVLVTAVIRNLHKAGLRVLATVCDQGASNVSCINYMIAETKKQYMRRNEEFQRNIFEIDGKEIIPLYDPPHLIKGIRNNLLENNLKCTIDGIPKLAKWEHLNKLHEENPGYSGIPLLENLTEAHINPEKCKMKVNFAAQIFSQKVASTMGYLAETNILPHECKDTADVLLFFDDLFDSFNGSLVNAKKRSWKPLLRRVSPHSSHNKVWVNAKKVLSTMVFVKNGTETRIPTVSNWLHTINNMEYLRNTLFYKYRIKSFWARHFNQDPLENYFGAIRIHGCRNIQPSPAGFEVAFASLLLTNFTGAHSPDSNCEQDGCKTMFKSMTELLKMSTTTQNSEEVDMSYINQNLIIDPESKKEDPWRWAQIEYVASYLLRQTKNNVFHNCSYCKESLINKNKDSEYVRARQFHKNKQALEYPVDELTKMFSNIHDILIWILKNHSNVRNVKKYAKTILFNEIDTGFMQICQNHSKKSAEFFFDLACRFFIQNWCKDINNLLKGRRTDTAGDDTVKNLAIEYFRKRNR